jgi:integral membrane sensor domain MASE1
MMYQESLSNLISINNDVLWGVILVMGHLISTTLALAIFSSILLQNKKNGLLFLILLIVMGVLTLYRVMSYSITLGLIIGFMYIILCFVTFISLRRKMTRENQL